MNTSRKNKERILKDTVKFQRLMKWSFIHAAKVAINHFYNEPCWLVGHMCQEANIPNDGAYHFPETYEISESGKSLKIIHEDKFIYVPISKTVNDGTVYFIPTSVKENAAAWTERELGTFYVGG